MATPAQRKLSPKQSEELLALSVRDFLDEQARHIDFAIVIGQEGRPRPTTAVVKQHVDVELGADAVDVANDECEHETLMAEIGMAETKIAEVDAALVSEKK